MADILNLATGQPVPELTNVAVGFWASGGWLADRIAPVKRVTKDSFKFGRWSDLVNKYNVKTERARGATGEIIEAPGRNWYDGLITESQLRAYYTDEEVHDSPNPDDPRISRVATITNALRYAVEARVAAAYAVSGIPAGQKDAVSVKWNNDASNPERDFLAAKAEHMLLTGVTPNYAFFGQIAGYNAFVSHPQVRASRGLYIRDLMSGQPESYQGVALLKAEARYDSAPTSGTFSPAFVWNEDAVFFGYSPSLDGGPWDGNAPVYLGQFESMLTGTNPFEVVEYLDPHYASNHVRWLVMSFRRDLEVIHPYLLYALTTLV
jgi:hypothetical protein